MRDGAVLLAEHHIPSTDHAHGHGARPHPLRPQVRTGRALLPGTRRPRLPRAGAERARHVRLGRRVRPDGRRGARRARHRGVAARAAVVRRSARHLRRLLPRLDPVDADDRPAAGAARRGGARRAARLRRVGVQHRGLRVPGLPGLERPHPAPGVDRPARRDRARRHRQAAAGRGAQRAAASRRRRRAVRRARAVVSPLARPPRPRRPVLGRQAGHGGAGALHRADAARRRLAGPVPRADGRAVPGARGPRRGRRVDHRPVDAPRRRHPRGRDRRAGDPGLARRAPRGRYRPHAPRRRCGSPSPAAGVGGSSGVAADDHTAAVAARPGGPAREHHPVRPPPPTAARPAGSVTDPAARLGDPRGRCLGARSSATTRPIPPLRSAGACSPRTRACGTTGGWPPAPTSSRSPHRRFPRIWSSRARPPSKWTTSPILRTPTCSSGSATSPPTVGRTTSPTACAGGIPRSGPITIELDPCFHRVAAGHRLALLVAGGAHPRFLRNNGTGEPPADAVGLVAVTHRIRGGTLTLPITDDH